MTTVGALAKAALVGAVYFCGALASLLYSHGPYGFASLWPASGILLAALLRSARQTILYLLFCAVASLAANRLAGGDWTGAAVFTLANLVEPLVARWLIGRIAGRPLAGFTSGRDLATLCIAALLASLASATIAAPLAQDGVPIFFLSWVVNDLLGMLTVTPLALIVTHAIRGRDCPARPDRRCGAVETAPLLALVTAVATGTFAQSTFPLLFLPLATVVLAAVRRGVTGAAASVVIISFVASTATALGTGPVTLIHQGRVIETFFLQLYLLIVFAAALPTAALLGAQRQAVEEMREKNRRLNLAEAAAQLGHWRFDLDGGELYWSDQTFRIHGLRPPRAPSFEEGMAFYLEEDRPRVEAIVARALRDGEPCEFRARIRRLDGDVRDVLARAEVDRDRAGRIVAIFGMMQDITEQVRQERALDDARILAEEAARAARIASETDALTGLPNRRQLLFVLESELRRAGEFRRPVSIAILDLDHFKRVNDTYGHVAGDRVLQRVAVVAGTALRGADMIGRLGGEEFIIVLPDADGHVAEVIAERVRSAIARDVGAPEGPHMTASLGVASWVPGEPLTLLLQRADEALYEAKRAGRNLVRKARALHPEDEEEDWGA